MAATKQRLENFKFKLDKNIIHMHTSGKGNYWLCVLYIPKLSSGLTLSTEGLKSPNGSTSIDVNINLERAQVEINSMEAFDKIDISFSTHAIEKIAVRNDRRLFSDSSIVIYSASVEGEDFQKLQNNACIITCRMIYSPYSSRYKGSYFHDTLAIESSYLKSLEADLQKCPSNFSKEKVVLCVNEETEIVNKAILCARSPVFAKMFENDMRELKQNTVTITDIKMPVLRALVSFLYTGLLMEGDVDVLCDLYYVAAKYDIWELRQACIRLLFTKINYGNIFRLLKLSVLHNDKLLKSAAMTLISANISTILMTSDWKELMCDDPEIALKASLFFDI